MFSMWVSITLIHDLYIYSSTAGKQCPLAKSYSDSKSDNQRGNVLLLWAGIQTQSCQTLMLQDYYILDIFQRGQKGQTWDFHLLSLSCSAFNYSATAPPNAVIIFCFSTKRSSSKKSPTTKTTEFFTAPITQVRIHSAAWQRAWRSSWVTGFASCLGVNFLAVLVSVQENWYPIWNLYFIFYRGHSEFPLGERQ